MHYIIHIQECFSCLHYTYNKFYCLPQRSIFGIETTILLHVLLYNIIHNVYMYFTSVCTVLCRCNTAQIKGLVHSQMSTCTQLNCCSVLSWLQDDKRSVVSSSQSSSIFDNSIYKHPNNVCQTSSDTCPAHVGPSTCCLHTLLCTYIQPCKFSTGTYIYTV